MKSVAVRSRNVVHGHVSPGFEAVREAFAENFDRRRELGGACCVYHRHEKIVDLWGGIRNKNTGAHVGRGHDGGRPLGHERSRRHDARPRPLARLARLRGASRDVLAEFAQQGKDRMTVRQLLAHQAGLFAIEEPVDRNVVADLDRLAVVLARQKPVWEPGTRQAYHAITLGFYEGESAPSS
jgi:CubicO group peptidase (beta-lactamase class C family)